jgi:hypothetical protein
LTPSELGVALLETRAQRAQLAFEDCVVAQSRRK